MKKLLALILVLLLTFSFALVACDEVVEGDGDGDANVSVDGSNDATVEDVKKTEVPENETPEPDNNEKEEAPFDMATATPESLYAKITKDISAFENVTITAKQNITMTVNLNGTEVPVQDIKQVVTQKYDKGNFSINATNNTEVSIDCRYVDGVVYNVQINDGAKIKYEASEKDLADKSGVDINAPKILNIPEEWFKNSKITNESASRYCIEFVLDGDAYETLFANFAALESVKEVSDITHTVYVTAEGEIEGVYSTATLIMLVEGAEVTAKMDSLSTYGDIGTTVVEAPADADSYTTVDISQLS